MAYSHFDKFKAFFSALNKSNYHPERMDPKIITPKDKAYCFDWLLKETPELKGKNISDLLEFLKDPKKVKAAVVRNFVKGESTELTKTLEEKPLAEGGVVYQQEEEGGAAEQAPQDGSSGSSGGGMPGMPSVSTPVTHPIFRTNRSSVPEAPKPEIHIATTSTGHVTEAGDASKLVIPGREAGDASKLVTSHSSGAIKEAPPKQIFITNKGAINVHSIKSPSWLKTLGSNSQIFAKQNFVRIGNGLKNMFGSAANLGGRTGLGAINHGGNFLSNLSNSRSRLAGKINGIGSRASSVGEVKKVSLVLGLFFMIVFVGALGGMLSNSSTGETAPIPSAPPYQPGAGKGIISCPLNGTPTITNGSEGAGGHCSRAYVQDYGTCAKLGDADYTGKEKAIDITSSDRQVYLPLINNSSVTWKIGLIDTNTDYTENGVMVNGGYSVRASTSSEGKTYLIRFVHMDQPSLQQGQTVSSETPVGTYRTEEAHVHITIQEDGTFQPADLYFQLCQP